LLTKWNDGVALTKNVNAIKSAMRFQRFKGGGRGGGGGGCDAQP